MASSQSTRTPAILEDALRSLRGALRINRWWLWAGFFIYLALGRVPHLDYFSRAQLTLLVAPLLTLPMGLRLLVGGLANAAPAANAGPLDDLASTLLKLALMLQLPLALVAIPAVLIAEPRWLNVLCAGLWAGWTAICAGAGVQRAVSRERTFGDLPELCFDIALIYLAVGGGWLVLDALAAQPLGFSREIVFFTAVHFHFAGFAVPVMAGLMGRWLVARSDRLPLAHKLWPLCAWSCVIGVMLVAVGITGAQLGAPLALELICSIPLILGLIGLDLMLLSCVVLREGPGLGRFFRSSAGWGRVLLALAALANIAAMLLAGMYGLSRMQPEGLTLFGSPLTIPFMSDWHGTINAGAFVLLGSFGWLLMLKGAKSTQP